MNINEKIMKLKEVTGYPAAPGIYKGDEDKYIIFVIEDERAALYADDEEQIEENVIQVQFICPYDFDYTDVKKQIKRTLKQEGFTIGSFREIINTNPATDEKESRALVFSVKISCDVATEE